MADFLNGVDAIDYSAAPGIVQPLIPHDPLTPDATMPESMSVGYESPVVKPVLPFENLPRQYRAKAIITKAQQEQEGEAADADAYMNAKYLADLQKQLEQTREGRIALRNALSTPAPQMPQTNTPVNTGEAVAGLLGGLIGHQWPQSMNTVQGMANQRGQRDYAQQMQGYSQQQGLVGMDYKQSLATEKDLQDAIDYANAMEADQAFKGQQSKLDRASREKIAATGAQGRIDVAALKTPQGIYDQLAPLIGHDAALRLATSQLEKDLQAANLSGAKAADVPQARASVNAKIAEEARNHRAIEGIQTRGMDIRQIAEQHSHEDRQKALDARWKMFNIGQAGINQRAYANLASRMAIAKAGGKLTDADMKQAQQTYGKLKTGYDTAKRKEQAATQTYQQLTQMGGDVDPKTLKKAHLDMIEASNQRAAFETDLNAAEDALGKDLTPPGDLNMLDFQQLNQVLGGPKPKSNPYAPLNPLSGPIGPPPSSPRQQPKKRTTGSGWKTTKKGAKFRLVD